MELTMGRQKAPWRAPETGGARPRDDVFAERAANAVYDVVVVGFGGAGACAAIEAADAGASVLLVERFEGGGATRRSGGVVYAGGGSAQQEAVGFKDDPETMAAYLMHETQGRVKRDLVERFCGDSVSNLQWLEREGVCFPARFYPHKATTPPDGYGLYYSGNELQAHAVARPAPRGHTPQGQGMAGQVLFDGLQAAVKRRAIPVWKHCRATDLVTDAQGAVTGVELLELPASTALWKVHHTLFQAAQLDRRMGRLLDGFERVFGRRRRVSARGGVVLASGGFVFNEKMMEKYAPDFLSCMPLGTPADDGGGIRMGQAVGGRVELMDECAVWRFIYPPQSFVRGLLVNTRGERVCDESLYGASLGRRIAHQPDSKAYLILDAAMVERILEELRQAASLFSYPLRDVVSGRINALLFQKFSARLNLHFNRRKALSLEELARRCEIPPPALFETVRAYNAGCRTEGDDCCGKPPDYCMPLVCPPFRAVDCGLRCKAFLAPCITLGGLSVDPHRGQVQGVNGGGIEGLYGAGRSSVGVCSGGYVSGLSIADCVFSGRRAGRFAAERAAALGGSAVRAGSDG